jgi:hypothetical protein
MTLKEIMISPSLLAIQTQVIEEVQILFASLNSLVWQSLLWQVLWLPFQTKVVEEVQMLSASVNSFGMAGSVTALPEWGSRRSVDFICLFEQFGMEDSGVAGSVTALPD